MSHNLGATAVLTTADLSPVDTLRRLRAEQLALSGILEKAANGVNDDQMQRDHRRELARVRHAIDELLPAALDRHKSCLEAIHAHRQRLDAIRTELTGVVPETRAAALEETYVSCLKSLGPLEWELSILHGFLPGLERDSLRPTPALQGVSRAVATTVDRDSIQVSVEDLAPELDDISATRTKVNASSSTRNRRANLRYPFIVPMKLRIGEHTFPARSADISLTGMFVETPLHQQSARHVTTLFCAESYPVEIAAEAVYESPGVGLGLRFDTIADVDKPYFVALLRGLAGRNHT